MGLFPGRMELSALVAVGEPEHLGITGTWGLCSSGSFLLAGSVLLSFAGFFSFFRWLRPLSSFLVAFSPPPRVAASLGLSSLLSRPSSSLLRGLLSLFSARLSSLLCSLLSLFALFGLRPSLLRPSSGCPPCGIARPVTTEERDATASTVTTAQRASLPEWRGSEPQWRRT